jgi:cellulose synthase/poly-beta-1,6-N-acetylglucosamine synthase-like glycosyltransferase
MKLDYPRELLEVQVLDDSTDETTAIAARKVEEYRQLGFNIRLLHRTDRTGYKAGALKEGLKQAKGEFVAIFDADFIPHPQFLKRSVHYFTDPAVAVVQMRWAHLNRKFNLLTYLQSVLLDGHFVIEQTARSKAGIYFNFNGTAGIWRKSVIDDAGGWEHDTLTEDLDLSYRAQMKGWKFVYLPHYAVPAELPVDIDGFKNQQHRWAKGSIQTYKKLMARILKSDMSLRLKINAFFHLAANFAYLLMIPLSISVLPVVLMRRDLNWGKMLIVDIPLFILATSSVGIFYVMSQKEIYIDWLESLKKLPLVMGLGIGLSVNNAFAVIEAIRNRESEFVRTPKYGVIQSGKSEWQKKKYRGNKKLQIAIIELILGLYFSYSVLVCITEGVWMTMPFIMLFQFGYLYVGTLSFINIFRSRALLLKLKPHSLSN